MLMGVLYTLVNELFLGLCLGGGDKEMAIILITNFEFVEISAAGKKKGSIYTPKWPLKIDF